MLGLGSFSFIFGKDYGYISQEMSVRFLTVQERPFKILVFNKQTVSVLAQGREAASHTGARKQPSLIIYSGLFPHIIFSSRSGE